MFLALLCVFFPAMASAPLSGLAALVLWIKGRRRGAYYAALAALTLVSAWGLVLVPTALVGVNGAILTAGAAFGLVGNGLACEAAHRAGLDGEHPGRWYILGLFAGFGLWAAALCGATAVPRGSVEVALQIATLVIGFAGFAWAGLGGPILVAIAALRVGPIDGYDAIGD